MNADEKQIEQLLHTYQEALNSSDTETVMTLYAPDGIFMAQYSPSSIGTEAVRAGYERVFGAIQLRVTFQIEEIQQVSEEWAFARTNSAGTVTVHATGEGGPEANQELFVFQKITGSWKIARYCFCSTNQPRG